MSTADSGQSSAGPLSPDILNFDDSGGGGGGKSQKCLEKAKKPVNLEFSGNSLPLLLITANVGSIFDDPQNLIPQWINQVCQQIKTQKPTFVAIHCQEVLYSFYESLLIMSCIEGWERILDFWSVDGARARTFLFPKTEFYTYFNK